MINGAKQVKIKDIVGRYSAGGKTTYFVREDAVEQVIKKDDVIVKKSVVDWQNKTKDDFLSSSSLCMEKNSKRCFENLYATRKLLAGLYTGTKIINGISPETDIHKIEGQYIGDRKGRDIYYIHKDKAPLITGAMITEEVMDIQYWELELLKVANKARRKTDASKAR